MKILLLTLMCFMFLTVSSAGAAKEKITSICQKLEEYLKNGKFNERRKISDECALKSFKPEHQNSMQKCRDILPLETSDDIKKMCSDMETSEVKIELVEMCVAFHSPAESRAAFRECLKKSLEKANLL